MNLVSHDNLQDAVLAVQDELGLIPGTYSVVRSGNGDSRSDVYLVYGGSSIPLARITVKTIYAAEVLRNP